MSFQDDLLKSYSGSVPLFPLPDFVLFPLTGHTFRIFEERYKEMVKIVLQGERFIGNAHIHPDDDTPITENPKIYPIGTLSQIVQYKERENGEYLISVFGIKKVQFFEAEKSQSYRIAATRFIEDITIIPQEDELRKKLFRAFNRLVELSSGNIEFDIFNAPGLTTEMMVNMICQALPIPWEEQQKLLELPDISLRLEVLCQFINSEVVAERGIDEFNQLLPIDPKFN